MLIKFIVCLVAGIGAGLGTGFAGMSAAAVISPMLITFLDMDPYMAVGIALASDVLASAASAYTYGKNKNIDIKNGIVMMIFVLLFTLVGSFVSSKVPSTTMGGFSFVMTLFLGIKFIVKPVTEPKARLTQATPKQKIVRSALCGAMVGFICGFIGAGGGMMCLHPFSDMNLKPQSEQAFLLWRLLHLPVQSVILQSAALPIGGH